METSLGDKLKKHRIEKGYSLDQLAKVAGASKSYLWELENRPARKPSAEKLTRIAAALSVTTDYLLDENADHTDEVAREAFYRKFNNLDKDTKEKIESMIDMWGSKD